VGQWLRVTPRATATYAPPRKQTSSLLPFPASGEEICHLQQKENAQTVRGFNRFLPLDRTILCLLSSSLFVSLCWWQIRPLAHGPDLLRGVEPMKKSRGLPGLHELAAGLGEWAVEAE
jgi:hypothetical protein